MQHQARSEAFDQRTALDGFVSERLKVEYGSKELVCDLYKEFLAAFPDDVNSLSYSAVKFGKDLTEVISELKSASGFARAEWHAVTKKNGRKNGQKGIVYENLKLCAGSPSPDAGALPFYV